MNTPIDFTIHLTDEDLTRLAARKGRQMHHYRQSWLNLQAYLAERYPAWSLEKLNLEATRQADHVHKVR